MFYVSRRLAVQFCLSVGIFISTKGLQILEIISSSRGNTS